MNKTIIAIVIVAAVIAGGYFLFKGAYRPLSPSVSQPSTQQTDPQSPAAQTPTTAGQIVTYTNVGYSPATLTVKRKETVIFKNQSSQSMWTASAVHPTHLLYPTTGGCIGSTFDACKGIRPDDSWPFRFDIAGTWKYHNHLNPVDTGIVIVQ